MNFFTQMYKVRDSFGSYDELLNDALMFTFAGYDTSAVSLSGILLLLAMNQGAQDKVVAELNEILLSGDEEVNEERLKKMIYMDLVIKESMRMFPINPLFGREATDDIKLSKYKSSFCWLNKRKIF